MNREPMACECPVCGYRASRTGPGARGAVRGNTRRHLASSFPLWQCPRCQTVRSLAPVDYGDIYADYPLNKRRMDYFARITLRNLLKRLRSAGLGKNDAILDYGCGNGLFVGYLKSQGYRHVFGYDPHVPEYARMPEAPCRFDAVVANDVIEHCDDPRALLRDCRAWLGPGGLLYVGMPDAEDIGAADLADPEPHIMRFHQPFHRVIMTRASLLKLGGELGLESAAVYRRSYMDTLAPFANYRFLDELGKALGHNMDLMLDPAASGRALGRHFRLWFYAFAGYFRPSAYEPAVLWRLAG